MFLNHPLIESPAHKCVIVLDRSPRFATPMPTPITTQIKDDQSQTTFTGLLHRTWWDASVEAVLEYHRVIADLFPYGSRLMRLVVSDFVGRFLTPQWGEELITYEQLLAELGSCDVPNGAGDGDACSILNGLSIGVEALSETTPLQKRSVEIMAKDGEEQIPRSKLVEPSPSTSNPWAYSREIGREWIDNLQSAHRQGETVQEMDGTGQLDILWRRLEMKNRGTIVVFTSLDKADQQFAEICEHVLEQVQARNESIKAVEHHDGLRSIDVVDLYVVNFSSTTAGPNWTVDTSNNSPFLRSTLIQLPPTEDSIETHLTANIHRLLHEVYDLASTTVSGIPMKEEAQPGQSINYDVELFHPRGALADLETNNFLSDKYSILDSPPHGVYKTVRLKWCTVTAKMRSDKFPLLLGSYPLTPAFVSSRPSVCLTQFVLAGKAVMLEVNRERVSGGNNRTQSIIPTRVEDIIASARDAVGPNLETQGKLISHFLVRDEVTNGLALQCVAMGKRASIPTAPALPPGVKRTPKEQLNLAAMKQLISAASLTPIAFTVKEQMAVMRGDVDPCVHDYHKEIDLAAKFGAYLPRLTSESVVYQLRERLFEPLLSLFPKWTLSDADWEQCRQAIMAFNNQKGANAELLTALKSVQVSGRPLMSDPFRNAMEELARVLANFSHLSPRHEQLLRLLCDTTGIPSGASSTVNMAHKSLKRAAPPSEFAREPKKPMVRVSLYDVCLQAYERKYEPVRRKKDFAGRQKWGDQAQGHLYPDLKLPPEGERPERGERPPRRGGPRRGGARATYNVAE